MIQAKTPEKFEELFVKNQDRILSYFIAAERERLTMSYKKFYEKGVFNSFQPYTTSTNSTLKSFEEAMEFNNFHEGIHLGYILALKKSL